MGSDPNDYWAGAHAAAIKALIDQGILNRSPAPRLAPQLAPAGREHVDSPDMESTAGLSQVAGRALFIEYRDADGHHSSRCVTLRHIDVLETDWYLHGYCHLRAAPRKFRGSRIEMAADATTGELIDLHHIVATDLRALLQLASPVLEDFVRVLVFIAWSDGRVHPSEADAIDAAIDAFLDQFGGDPADAGEARRFARLAAVEGIDMANALGRLAAQPDRRAILSLLGRHVDALIAADGIETRGESDWRMIVRRTIRRAMML